VGIENNSRFRVKLSKLGLGVSSLEEVGGWVNEVGGNRKVLIIYSTM